MSRREVTTVEDRALEIERMQKCIAFAGSVMAIVSDSFQKSEHAEIDFVGEFGIEQFAPLLEKQGMLCADYRKQKLLSILGEVIVKYGPTSCAVWEFGHFSHHIIFDEDIPK